MTISATNARADLFNIIEQVNVDHVEVEITSKSGSVILMSKEEYTSLMETNHLLRSPKNAQRLLQAIKSAQVGDIFERDLAAS